jgi:hypothetical protein
MQNANNVHEMWLTRQWQSSNVCTAVLIDLYSVSSVLFCKQNIFEILYTRRWKNIFINIRYKCDFWHLQCNTVDPNSYSWCYRTGENDGSLLDIVIFYMLIIKLKSWCFDSCGVEQLLYISLSYSTYIKTYHSPPFFSVPDLRGSDGLTENN